MDSQAGNAAQQPQQQPPPQQQEGGASKPRMPAALDMVMYTWFAVLASIACSLLVAVILVSMRTGYGEVGNSLSFVVLVTIPMLAYLGKFGTQTLRYERSEWNLGVLTGAMTAGSGLMLILFCIYMGYSANGANDDDIVTANRGVRSTRAEAGFSFINWVLFTACAVILFLYRHKILESAGPGGQEKSQPPTPVGQAGYVTTNPAMGYGGVPPVQQSQPYAQPTPQYVQDPPAVQYVQSTPPMQQPPSYAQAQQAQPVNGGNPFGPGVPVGKEV